MKSITIGREDSCDIVINNERVSRIHASIVREGNGYLYRDMSSNGTLVNGMMIKNREVHITFGDQVLLAGNIPLPWNQIQYDEEYESVAYKSGTGLIIFGYIIAVLGGWLAIVFGSILVSKQTTPDGKKVNKYKPSSVTNGWIIIGIAIFSTIIQIIYFISK